jgi:hypothetical protein
MSELLVPPTTLGGIGKAVIQVKSALVRGENHPLGQYDPQKNKSRHLVEGD